MADGITCLVTIHGIGFQQAPSDGAMGYADQLHASLARCLGGTILGDDPIRTSLGESGPVYVQSTWPPESHNIEAGLSRLGSWVAGTTRAIDTSKAPLIGDTGRIAHVALVYSHLEDQGAHPGALLEISSSSLLSLGHYASLGGLVHMGFADLQAILSHPHLPTIGTPSLAVRTDMPDTSHHVIDRILRRPVPTGPQTQTGLFATLRALEADVAAYVSRNDLRERVRDFVRDALHRICYRDDVSSVVVNAHSNGTVIGFDVLNQLTPVAAQKVQYFVTAGSPLRKYAELFYWGSMISGMQRMAAPQGWTNFWDERDPVADPLAPPVSWHRGDALPEPSRLESLFEAVDPAQGTMVAFPVEDRRVDNLANSSGGGLQAHNYWDNENEVVKPLADILRQVVDGQEAIASM